MENQVYVMYNKLSGRYESVMSFPSDAIAIHRLSDKIDLKEYDVCRIGSIDINTGLVNPSNPVRLVLNSSDIQPEGEAK